MTVQCVRCGTTSQPDGDGALPPRWSVVTLAAYRDQAQLDEAWQDWCPTCWDALVAQFGGDARSVATVLSTHLREYLRDLVTVSAAKGGEA